MKLSGLAIQRSISELHELTFTIKELDKLLVENPENEMNQVFMEEVISRYKKLVDKTKIQLEAFFAEEAKLGLPTDFLFRRLYRKLEGAY